MKKSFFTVSVLGLVLTLTACTNVPAPFNFLCENGSGNIITETREVAEFDRINLMVPANLYVSQGDTNSFSIEGDDNLLEEIETDLDGTFLEIELKNSVKCLNPTQEINIWVTMKEVKELAVSGSGNIVGETAFETDSLEMRVSGSGKISNDNQIKADSLELRISGSGDVDLDVVSKTITTRISGSGNVALEGVTEIHEFQVSGSGELNAYDLDTQKSVLGVSGSGKAELKVSEELEINIAGSGNVKYKGAPEKVTQNVSGSGSVEKVE